MKDVNKIILIGRLGTDPTQRETKNGTTVVHFPVATSRRINKEGEDGQESYSEETQWHRVIAWGKQGETCAQFLRKGQSVYVEGSLRSRQYEGKDGMKRMAFEIHAENVSFLGGRPKAAADPVSEGEIAAAG